MKKTTKKPALKESPKKRKTMSNEDNGNLCAGGVGASNVAAGLLKPTSSSNEDLSEYTDADESISAPTEVLAEFLSAVMLKDYGTALKYCKLILQYEPNNVTAKDFYPLILEKLEKTYNKQSPSPTSDDPDSNSNSASESDDNDSSSSSSDSSSSSSDEAEEEEEEEISVDGEQEDKRHSSDGDATTASYSSLEDEEAEADQLTALAAKYKVDNMDLGNGNKIICNSTTKWNTNNATAAVGVPPFGTSSDSESPTEPISQQTIAMLRAKVIPPKH